MAAWAGSRTKSSADPADAADRCGGRVLGIFQPPLRVMRMALSRPPGGTQAQSPMDQLFCQDLFYRQPSLKLVRTSPVTFPSPKLPALTLFTYSRSQE